MPYQESRVIYDVLMKRGLADPRIVIFNAARFSECAEPDSDFWKLAELVVDWRENRKGTLIFSPLLFLLRSP